MGLSSLIRSSIFGSPSEVLDENPIYDDESISFAGQPSHWGEHPMAEVIPRWYSSHMSTETLLIIIVLILVFGGGGFFWSRRR